jgi:hypothetical protein
MIDTTRTRKDEECHRYGSPSSARGPAQEAADRRSRSSRWTPETPTSSASSNCSADCGAERSRLGGDDLRAGPGAGGAGSGFDSVPARFRMVTVFRHRARGGIMKRVWLARAWPMRTLEGISRSGQPAGSSRKSQARSGSEVLIPNGPWCVFSESASLRPAGIRDSGWRIVRSGAGREDANRSGR